MFNLLRLLFDALVPPIGADEIHTYKWRLTVAGLLTAVGGLSVTNTVIMFGLWPALFGAGFAHADNLSDFARKADIADLQTTLQEVTAELKSNQISALEQQVYNLRVLECNALKIGNALAAEAHGRRLSELNSQYHMIVGYDYFLRPCAEF